MLKMTIALVLLTTALYISASSQQLAKHEPLATDGEIQFSSGDYLLADNIGPQGIYTNNKRARKMSAFMPMRGRKDGREQRANSNSNLENNLREQSLYKGDFGSLSPNEQSATGSNLREFRESDLDSPSILRLIADNNNARDWPAVIVGMPTPRQFANQLAARHLMLTSPVELYGLGGEPQASGGEQVMQAKLRRAFHPMRGKRSAGEDMNEINYLGDLQTD